MNIEYRILNIENRNSRFLRRCSAPVRVLLCSCVLMGIAAGCENGGGGLAEQISTLRWEKTELSGQLEQARAENEQSKRQIQVLSGLKAGVRLENLYDLQTIRITGYTNLYDKDRDGKYEELIVYIQPFDAEADIVKASGSVDVQLWDLNAQDGRAMLSQWRVEPAELKTMWFATLITINYRLVFDVSEIVEKYDRPLTVKVTFTDYLTGKVFEEQTVIERVK